MWPLVPLLDLVVALVSGCGRGRVRGGHSASLVFLVGLVVSVGLVRLFGWGSGSGSIYESGSDGRGVLGVLTVLPCQSTLLLFAI